jgi:hypothetical protein
MDSTNWIQTYSGRRFYLDEPRAEDVDIIDIAVALSRIARFGGHTYVFYSVAQHSVLASQHVLIPGEVYSDDCAYWATLSALLHDATEAYCGDLTRPLKIVVGKAYSNVEAAVYRAIATRFNLPESLPSSVKLVDNRLLMTERRELMRVTKDIWSIDAEPFPFVINAVGPDEALEMFLKRYEQITGEQVDWDFVPSAAA